jgi:hypothetical protein
MEVAASKLVDPQRVGGLKPICDYNGQPGAFWVHSALGNQKVFAQKKKMNLVLLFSFS